MPTVAQVLRTHRAEEGRDSGGDDHEEGVGIPGPRARRARQDRIEILLDEGQGRRAQGADSGLNKMMWKPKAFIGLPLMIEQLMKGRSKEDADTLADYLERIIRSDSPLPPPPGAKVGLPAELYEPLARNRGWLDPNH
jgi:hypothetical protein